MSSYDPDDSNDSPPYILYNNKPIFCDYRDCRNLATGRCSGRQRCEWKTDSSRRPFMYDCEKYCCSNHLKLGWGLPCVNCCTASKQCPDCHTGVKCCTIM